VPAVPFAKQATRKRGRVRQRLLALLTLLLLVVLAVPAAILIGVAHPRLVIPTEPPTGLRMRVYDSHEPPVVHFAAPAGQLVRIGFREGRVRHAVILRASGRTQVWVLPRTPRHVPAVEVEACELGASGRCTPPLLRESLRLGRG
jgi:hypothetical protein